MREDGLRSWEALGNPDQEDSLKRHWEVRGSCRLEEVGTGRWEVEEIGRWEVGETVRQEAEETVRQEVEGSCQGGEGIDHDQRQQDLRERVACQAEGLHDGES